MGIKNIHLTLISVSVALALVFGIWAFKNAYALLGGISMASSVGLVFYGIHFVKKTRALS